LIKVYDFFSGCGGASCGFKKAGMQIVLGLDNNPDAAATFMKNFPEAVFIKEDIRKVSVHDLEKYYDTTTPSLFCGCAPCQPFSKQNSHKKRNDERINLLKEFGRFVEYYLPDYIFVENVPGIQNFSLAMSPLADFCEILKKLNYARPLISVVEASRYGVPQIRKRLVMIVSKNYNVNLPPFTHGLGTNNPTYSTVRDWIANFPKLRAGEVDKNDPDHCAASLSEINLKRIRATREGGNRQDWPKELWLDCHKKYRGHSDVYGRLAYDKPASAMTTRCISYSNGRFGHPVEDRAISVREAACLQTFSRTYRFCGSMNSKAKQIGNAVPPLMAQRFGEVFIEIEKTKKLK
jgi:DNA (cytosine-5)-methyltransferase 1